MARIAFAFFVLAAFFVRDLRLLATAGRSRIATACAAYAVLFFLYAAGVGFWLHFVHIQKPDLITIGGATWTAILTVHLSIWGITWQMSRGWAARWVWLVSLVPAPAVLLSLCFAAGALPAYIGISLGLMSLPLFSLTWIALMVPLAYEIVWTAPSHPFLSPHFVARLFLQLAHALNWDRSSAKSPP